MADTVDHITVGETSITYLTDGFGVLNPDAMLAGVDWSAHPGSLDEDGRLVLGFGSFLVRAGDRKILVDLALGEMDVELPGLGHATGGKLLHNLAAQGLSPDDIDTVVYTHLHLDHIGWTSDVPPVANTPEPRAPSGLTFSRARHLVAEAEWRYWTSEGAGAVAGPDAEATIRPLEGVVEFVRSGDTIAPGVTVEDTSGHTPGHLAVVARDPSGARTESVFIVGDILHAPLEIADSVCAFTSDVDPDRARAVRDRVLRRPDTVIAAGHFTHGVFGRATPMGSAYKWTPLSHAPTAG